MAELASRATRSRMLLSAVLLFMVVFAMTWAFVRLVEDRLLEERHAAAETIGAAMGSATQRQLDRSLSTTLALASLIRVSEGFEIDDFDAVAAEMIEAYGGIDSLQLAPDGVVSQIYPLAGNEPAIGHDLLNDPARRTEALATIESRRLTLAGLFTLVQGGVAVIGRYPVFVPDGAGGDRFWGFTNALIRMPSLLGAVDLEQIVEQGYDYELSRTHPDTGDRDVFVASAAAEIQGPESFTFQVPNDVWTLSVAPSGGWKPLWGFALEFFAPVVIAVLSATLFHGCLLRTAERRRAEEALRDNEEKYRSLMEQSRTSFLSAA